MIKENKSLKEDSKIKEDKVNNMEERLSNMEKIFANVDKLSDDEILNLFSRRKQT